jgi:hypothetical protein
VDPTLPALYGQGSQHKVKLIEVSLTVSRRRTDIQYGTFAEVADWLRKYCNSFLVSTEKGGFEGHLHIQGYIAIRATAVSYANQQLRKHFNWGSDYTICMRPLRYEGLHTRAGIIGYSMKDENKPWFMMERMNVSDEEIEEGKRLYMLLGASLKGRVPLTYRNLLEKAHLYAQFHSNINTRDIDDVLLHMLRSGQYYPSIEFIKPLPGHGFDHGRLQACWTMLLNPSNTTYEQMSWVLFETRGGRRGRFMHGNAHAG